MKRSVALRLNDANDNKSEPASSRSEADLCQDFGHASSRDQVVTESSSGLDAVRSKKAVMASAGTL